MPEMKMESTTLSRLKKIVNQLENFKEQSEIVEDEDMEVAFEYIIASLFPKAYQNIKDTCTAFYIDGYNEGKKENEN